MDGPRNPHHILSVLGETELQKYMGNEVQEVYRLKGVNINDKHLEVIVRQILRWVKIDEIGDTEFHPEEVEDCFKFKTENTRAIESGGRPSRGNPILLGITKASCQETTRVLTGAAINGKVDYLRGLKKTSSCAASFRLERVSNMIAAQRLRARMLWTRSSRNQRTSWLFQTSCRADPSYVRYSSSPSAQSTPCQVPDASSPHPDSAQPLIPACSAQRQSPSHK